MSISDNNKVLNHQLQQDFLKGKNQKNLEKVTYTKVRVVDSGLAFRGYKVIPETTFDHLSKSVTRHLLKVARVKLIKSLFSTMKVNEAYIIHHPWSNGYFHWLIDCLPKTMRIMDKQAPIYIPTDYPKFCIDSLELLGFKNIIEFKKNHTLQVNKAHFFPHPISGIYSKSVLENLVSNIQNNIEFEISQEPIKAYISRSNAKLRRVVNEKELINLLTKYNYKIIRPEELSFKEQIKIFSNVNTLISVHGAGLTNMIFTQKNTIITELYRSMEDESDRMNLVYARLASTLNKPYSCIFGETIKGEELVHKDRRDIKIDIHLFKERLDNIEAQLGELQN